MPKIGHILIIEDTHDITTWIQNTSLAEQFSVRRASHFQEALIDLKHPDLRLVLLDQNFEHLPKQYLLNKRVPTKEGLAILREIRHRFPLVRVVFVTAFPEPQNIQKAGMLGAIDYLEWDHLVSDPEGVIQKLLVYINPENHPEMQWVLQQFSSIPPYIRMFVQFRRMILSHMPFILIGFPGAPKDLLKQYITSYQHGSIVQLIDFRATSSILLENFNSLAENTWLWVEHPEYADTSQQEILFQLFRNRRIPAVWFSFHHPATYYFENHNTISEQILALPSVTIPQISSLSSPERLTLFQHRHTIHGGDFSKFSQKAQKFIEEYTWPGDWFHLDYAAQALALKSKHHGGIIHLTDVVEILGHPPDWKDDPVVKSFLRSHTIDEVQRFMIQLALEECDTKEEAARRLGISRATLYNKLREDAEKV